MSTFEQLTMHAPIGIWIGIDDENHPNGSLRQLAAAGYEGLVLAYGPVAVRRMHSDGSYSDVLAVSDQSKLMSAIHEYAIKERDQYISGLLESGELKWSL